MPKKYGTKLCERNKNRERCIIVPAVCRIIAIRLHLFSLAPFRSPTRAESFSPIGENDWGFVPNPFLPSLTKQKYEWHRDSASSMKRFYILKELTFYKSQMFIFQSVYIITNRRYRIIMSDKNTNFVF